MKPNRRLWAALAVLLAACVAFPVQEMSDARQALESAREVGADRKAPEALREAEAWLKRADRDLEDGFYKRAREHAQMAKEAAIRAREQALRASGPGMD